MAYSRQKVVDLITSWLGKNEKDGSFKSIIDIYNSYTPRPRGIKMEYDWEWCACTWSALAIKLGYTKIMPIEISCYYIIEAAKKMGCWIESDSYVPKPGDAVLYDWDDTTGVSRDNTGHPDHIGTVVSVNVYNDTFTVIEGNMSEKVGKRVMPINGKYIRGFIAPKYDEETSSAPASTPVPVATTGKVLNESTKGMGVVNASLLNVRTWAGKEYKTVSFSPLKKGTPVGICDVLKDKNGDAWYYIYLNKKHGFAMAKWIDVKSGEAPKEKTYKVGDIVTFTGSEHYTNANGTYGKSCKSGPAKITQIYNLGKSKHPYHLIATSDGGSTVHGWVDEKDVK